MQGPELTGSSLPSLGAHCAEDIITPSRCEVVGWMRMRMIRGCDVMAGD